MSENAIPAMCNLLDCKDATVSFWDTLIDGLFSRGVRLKEAVSDPLSLMRAGWGQIEVCYPFLSHADYPGDPGWAGEHAEGGWS